MFKLILIYYFNLLAKLKLKFFFRGKIIGLAGCFGKSSAINFLEQLLSAKYKVKSTNISGKGLNSESGLPFIILGINPDGYSILDWGNYCLKALWGFFQPIDAEILLLEMGVDKPNDMKFLTDFYKPHIGILINSNNTHSANFEELHLDTQRSYEDLISHENGYIFARAKEAIFYNLEDPEVIKQIHRFKHKLRFGYSTSKGAIKDFHQNLKGTKIKFKYYGNDYNLNFHLPLLNEYQSTFELGIKLAEYMQIEGKQIQNAIENYNLPPGRCQIFKGINNTHILDSSYNSSYVPTSAALSLLNKIAVKRRIAFLGDMRELGTLAEKEHRKLALKAVEYTDIVFALGPLMNQYFVPEFDKIKAENQKIISFTSTKNIIEFLRINEDFLEKEDVILIKGSQNTLFMESIVEELLADKGEAKKLCRRGQFYEARRQEILN